MWQDVHNLYVCLCLVLYFIISQQQSDPVRIPIVGLELSAAGLHRELLYTLQFDYSWTNKGCEYVLLQPLPAAVYISVDQLDDLKRFKKLNAIYPAFVDIEVPAERATAFNVLLKGVPKRTDDLVLPIHYRYHAPSEERSFAAVDIAPPTMYLRCPDSEESPIHSDYRLQALPSTSFCLDDRNSNIVESSDFARSALDVSGEDKCNWKLVNVDYQLKTSLQARIPIGNASAYPFVLYATIITSWIASLWIVFRTQSVPLGINRQLEDQRILENKSK